MYGTFSHTFSSATHGEKKFFLTYARNVATPSFEGKINDDKSVRKFQIKQDDAGTWKIQPQQNVPEWVMALEGDFSNEIETRATR